MASNPNPVRISGPMWQWIERCCSLTSTPTSQEQAGVWVRQPGSHADAGWLLQNRPGDYSLRGKRQQPKNARQGQYGRAWDWGFPSAWSGDWSQIGIYSERVRVAWETDDPRTWPLFEVLCQTPEDREPEGFVFYPEKRFRVPDRSHETHMHNGILTDAVDDERAFEDLWSLYRGEPLAAWRRRNEGGLDVQRLTIAQSAHGQKLACDGIWSRPINDAELVDLVYLADEGRWEIAWGDKPGVPRGGWYEGGFGQLTTRASPLVLPADDRTAITAEVTAGVLTGLVAAGLLTAGQLAEAHRAAAAALASK